MLGSYSYLLGDKIFLAMNIVATHDCDVERLIG